MSEEESSNKRSSNIFLQKSAGGSVFSKTYNQQTKNTEYIDDDVTDEDRIASALFQAA
jgi:hypothetical protein